MAIARLSKKSQSEWEDKLETTRGISVVALVSRYREDVSDKDFGAGWIGDSWEVPIVEIVR